MARYNDPNRPIVLVDMDGVLCDWQAQFNELLENHYPHIPVIPREEISVFKAQSLYDQEYHAEIAEMMNREGFYRTLRPIEGAVKAMKEMAEEYNVFICTAPYVTHEGCASEKMLWVQEHLGSEWLNRMVITSDKTLVEGVLLIDDKPNIKGMGKRVWKHVVFDASYNQGIYPRIDRWADWRKTVEPIIAEAMVAA